MTNKASLKVQDGNPFLYLEDSAGSTCFGVNDAANRVNLITSNAVTNLDPSSGGAVFSIDQTANGNIEFAPHGSGQSTFVNGDVEIQGTGGTPGNLLMQNTTVGGLSGVIEFGGNRFVHNYGGLTNNTFAGRDSGNFSNTGFLNVGVGTDALTAVTSGDSNVAIGASAAVALTDGQNNVAIGISSLSSATSAQLNTAVGQSSLGALTNAQFNTAIGNGALGSLLTGSSNIALGSNAATNLVAAEANNIMIGNGGTAGDNDKIIIGSSQTTAFIAGINGVTLGAPAGTVVIDALGQLGTVATIPTPPFAWSQVTGASQAAAANSGYIANRAGLVTVTLIAAASAGIGTTLRVTGMNTALGWAIAQNASQQIFFGSASTTAGITGSLASTAIRDSVELVCITADGLFWNVLSSVGNITVT
jgi:hypothetical protein